MTGVALESAGHQGTCSGIISDLGFFGLYICLKPNKYFI